MVHATVDLNPLKYQSSINALRTLLESGDGNTPFLLIAVRTPGDETVEVQMRRSDAYIVAFKAADGWYSFDGEPGAMGKSCGTGSNYNQLGAVGRIVYDDLKRLGELGRFRAGARLDKRLLAILIALTSEAARFATVATYFTGLTNSVGTAHSAYLHGGVDFEHLRHNYFTRWTKPPRVRRRNPAAVEPLDQSSTASMVCGAFPSRRLFTKMYAVRRCSCALRISSRIAFRASGFSSCTCL